MLKNRPVAGSFSRSAILLVVLFLGAFSVTIGQEYPVLSREILTERVIQFDKHFFKLAEEWDDFYKTEFDKAKEDLAKIKTDLANLKEQRREDRNLILGSIGCIALFLLAERGWILFGHRRGRKTETPAPQQTPPNV